MWLMMNGKQYIVRYLFRRKAEVHLKLNKYVDIEECGHITASNNPALIGYSLCHTHGKNYYFTET